MEHDGHVGIRSRDYWFKIVEFLQQNWALIDEDAAAGTCTVYFLSDTSGVFDRLSFPSVRSAEYELGANGFRRYRLDRKAQSIIRPPDPPFVESVHPLGPIYSSGRFWKRRRKSAQPEGTGAHQRSLAPGAEGWALREKCADCQLDLLADRRGFEWEFCDFCGEAVCSECEDAHACERLRSDRPSR